MALQKHGEQCSRFPFPSASCLFSCDSCLQFSAGGGFVAACNKQNLIEDLGILGHLVLGGSRGGHAVPCTWHEG